MKLVYLAVFALFLSQPAAAEIDLLGGAVMTSLNSSTIPSGDSSTGTVGGEGGLLLRMNFHTHLGAGVGAVYRQVTLNLSNGSANTAKYSENQVVLPAFLNINLGDHFFVYGGGEYWTVASNSFSGTGSFAGLTTANAYSGFAMAGVRPIAGIGIEVEHLLILAHYNFATTVNIQTPTNWTESEYGIDIGYRFPTGK